MITSFGQGKHNGKGRALSGKTLHGDGSPVQVNNALCKGKSQTVAGDGPGWVAPIKLFKDPGRDFFAHTRTAIGNGYNGVVCLTVKPHAILVYSCIN